MIYKELMVYALRGRSGVRCEEQLDLGTFSFPENLGAKSLVRELSRVQSVVYLSY